MRDEFRDEHIPLSPSLPTAYSSNLPSHYGAVSSKLEPPGSDASKSAFQASFAQKYAIPIITRSSTFETDFKDDKKALGPRSWLNSISRSFTNWWLAEILLWLLSSTCLFIMVIILGVHDNQSLPAQSATSISLNTMVAILSTLAKYSIAVPIESCLGQLKWSWFKENTPRKFSDIEHFDKASRGPWGSFVFLLNVRSRSVASLGAIIIILSLGLDPFFQQLVSYPQRPATFEITGLSRSVNFSTTDTIHTYPNGEQAIWADETIYRSLRTSMQEDISQLKRDPICAAESCLWPSFKTLGVCSKCQDVSDLLTLGCLSENGFWSTSRNLSVPGFGIYSNVTTNVTSCGYYLNATSTDPKLMVGYMLNYTNNPPTPGEGLWMSTLSLYLSSVNVSYWDRSYHFKESTWPIRDFIVVMNPNVSSIYTHEKPMAAECVLQWCVQTVEGRTNHGVYEEVVQSIYANDSVLPEQYKWHYNTQSNSGGAHTEFDIYLIPPGQNETFFVPKNVNSQTEVLFDEFFPSYLTVPNSTTTESFWKVDNLVWDGESDPVLAPFYHEEWPQPQSVSEYSERIATAITMEMRRYPNASLPVSGFAGVESYIRIAWGWFALPMLLIIGTLIMLVITILKAPLRGAGGVWKTSLLASLLHGLEDGARHDFGDAWELSDMREKAQLIEVMLVPEINGFRFHRRDLA